MRLGAVLGEEAQKALDRAANRQQRSAAKARRKARLNEVSRAKQRGEMIVYKPGDL